MHVSKTYVLAPVSGIKNSQLHLIMAPWRISLYPEPWYRGIEANRGLIEATSRPHRGLIEASIEVASRLSIEALAKTIKAESMCDCIEASRVRGGVGPDLRHEFAVFCCGMPELLPRGQPVSK